MKQVFRLFPIFMLFFSSFKALALVERSKLIEMKRLDLERSKLVEAFTKRKFKPIVVRFVELQNAKSVHSIELHDDFLRVYLFSHYKSTEVKYPREAHDFLIEDIEEGARLKDGICSLSPGMNLYFIDEEEAREFYKQISEIKKRLRKCNKTIQEIFNQAFLSNGENKSSVTWPRGFFTSYVKRALKKLEEDFYRRQAFGVLHDFLEKFKDLEVESSAKSTSLSEFQRLAMQFFYLIKQKPSVIHSLDIEVLTSFLIEVERTIQHKEGVEEAYVNCFLGVSGELHHFLSWVSEKNGRLIKRFYEYPASSFSREKIFQLLRVESDILYLIRFHKSLLEGKYGNEDPDKPFSYYGRKSFIQLERRCRVHAGLLLDVFKRFGGTEWKEEIEGYLNEAMVQHNSLIRRDFSFYGRWSYIGKALKGHLTLREYIEADKKTESLSIKFRNALLNAKSVMRDKKLTYAQACGKLEAKIYSAYRNHSALHLLGVINLDEVVRDLDKKTPEEP